MGVVLLTGSHLRHQAIVDAVASSGQLAGVVIEQREEFVPQPPDGLPEGTRKLFIEHFEGRANSEQRFFSRSANVLASLEVAVLEVTREHINGVQVHEFLRNHAPDLLLSYGVHKLSPETLAQAPGHRWNIHGGLSPWYRGVITHFWPSYCLEPQMTGMTVHLTTDAIDGGAIVHQCTAPLVRGDGVHDLACRAVTELCTELPRLIEISSSPELQAPVKQRTTGRIWRSKDWRPAHLHVVYELYENRVVDRYLDGELGQAAPKLVRQQIEVAAR